ncbi:MAG: P-loop NTPase fold protein [Stenotrophomonas sp.]
MIRKEAPPVVDPASPWKGDIFDRLHDGRVLSNLIAKSADQALTISLQAPWGSGKTVFLQRLKAHIHNEFQIKAISVDTWKYDHHGDPLAPILAQLLDVIEERAEKERPRSALRKKLDRAGSELANTGAKYILPALSATAKVTVPGYASLVEGIEKVAASLLERQRELMNSEPAFRSALEAARDAISARRPTEPIRPILFIIDELDRCRPDYAIQTLERIKHHFDVPGIIFIVATDHGNLPAAVQTVYGAHVNGEEYLRKFFDFEYHLSPASREAVTQYLLNSAGLGLKSNRTLEGIVGHPSAFGIEQLNEEQVEELDRIEYGSFFTAMSSAFQLSPRDQIRAFTLIYAFYITRPKSFVTIPFLDCFIACLRFGSPQNYIQLSSTGVISIPGAYSSDPRNELNCLMAQNYNEVLEMFVGNRANQKNALYAVEKRVRESSAGANLGVLAAATSLARCNQLRDFDSSAYIESVIRLSRSLNRDEEVS